METFQIAIGFLAIALVGIWIIFPLIVWVKLGQLLDCAMEIESRLRTIVNQTVPTPKAEPPQVIAPNKFNPVCRCNVCSQPIEFERHRAGQTVVCPHCQMETRLYL